jgi:hypothetical protein
MRFGLVISSSEQTGQSEEIHSMVATIRADGKGGGEQIFRYAPLSSGLDIVRKTLGKRLFWIDELDLRLGKRCRQAADRITGLLDVGQSGRRRGP